MEDLTLGEQNAHKKLQTGARKCRQALWKLPLYSKLAVYLSCLILLFFSSSTVTHAKLHSGVVMGLDFKNEL